MRAPQTSLFFAVSHVSLLEVNNKEFPLLRELLCVQSELEKWHSLMERGAITTEQYKELQDKIMSNIKDF